MLEVPFIVLGLAWPLFVWLGAGYTSGEYLLPARVAEWLEDRELERWQHERDAKEREPAGEEFTTGVLASEEGWSVDPGERLTGRRWWRHEPRGGAVLLVVEQDDFLFGPHWCVYEVIDLEPALLWAVPKDAVRTVQDLLGDTVQPAHAWEPRRGACDYPWAPVPAYVERSLASTAAWVGRNAGLALSI